MTIDVCDTKNIWCEAKVLNIVIAPSPKLCIHYEGWSKRFDEVIDWDSPRIAPHKFITSRKEIPHYVLNNSGNCNYAYVVSGNEEPPRQPPNVFAEILLRNFIVNSDDEDNEEVN